MSCYFRHMQGILDEAGIKITPANKKQVDQAIHKIVNVSYKNCPAAWEEIKLGIADAQKRKQFVEQLKNAVAG
jgi:hypothetical protein